MSKWTDHVEKWKDCQLCDLCKTRKNVVLARGQVPCDVLLVGEAPGSSEDIVGRPFVGPAGKLLDEIIARAVDGLELCKECNLAQYETPSGMVCSSGHGGADSVPIRIAFTNLVACIPIGEEGSKTAEPPVESIKACQPRLGELIELAKPQLIVMVGKLSEKWVPFSTEGIIKRRDEKPVQWCSITHPAAILRADITQKDLLKKRCVVTLRDATERTFQ